MKKFLSTVLSLLTAFSVCLAPACSDNKGGDEQTLEVYCVNAGYRYQWTEDLLDLFTKQDWVKEKYPNIKTTFYQNDRQDFGASKLGSGAKANSYDLMFFTNGENFFGDEGTVLNLTEKVYDSYVPGETDANGKQIKVVDKMDASYVKSCGYIDTVTGKTNYYCVPWAGGMAGFLYNEDILVDQLGLKVPNTTDEMYAACVEIRKQLGDNKCFLQSNDANYWGYLFNIWWAQYEGYEGFDDFWNGKAVVGGRKQLSNKIFEQKGRVKSLEIYEKLLKYDEKFFNPSSFTLEFMSAQKMFLDGASVFHVNGDWYPMEMASFSSDYTIKMMKTPVVSSILENNTRLEGSIENDKELSALITAIDEGNSALEGEGYSVSQKDYDVIKEARQIVFSIGARHNSFIPAYSNAKDVAVDFLRFMSTDIACEAYIKATMGSSLPFNYEATKNSELMQSLSPLHQTRLSYFCDSFAPAITLPNTSSYPLARYGGVKAFENETYFATFYADGNKTTPMDFYNDSIAAWTEENFKFARQKAGL